MDLWYFAYGSNLDAGTFLGRRRMRPTAARAARLDGYRLVFDLPIGKGERGVANLEPSPADSVYGVVYALSSEGASHLDRTEGVHLGAYRRLDVAVEILDGEQLRAFTYLSALRAPGRKPSRRYLDLILNGARRYGLPADYVAWLESLELAVEEPNPS
jgi:gamma-glutamylcyclotransferase (GGCT)/AIG2-like uncharacterized protein YtfP